MSDFIFFLTELVTLACGILLFFRYRNMNVGIFGGIGFAALFFFPLLQRTLWEIGIEWFRVRFLFDLFFLAAYCLILYALYIMPAAGGTEEQAPFKIAEILKPPPPRTQQALSEQASAPASYSPYGPRPVSKPFYLGSILGATTISLILFALAFFLMMDNDEEEAIIFWIFGFMCAGYGMVVFAVLIHTMWKVIQDGRVRTTPGKAVGYLFIPFYNLYWIFQSFLGWAQDFNNYIKEKDINTSPIPEGFVKALCIIAVLQAIPYVGWPISIFYMMLMSIFIDRICDAVNTVISYKLENQREAVVE